MRAKKLDDTDTLQNENTKEKGNHRTQTQNQLLQKELQQAWVAPNTHNNTPNEDNASTLILNKVKF